mmetsp:Transcript_45818/g.127536  ORF Transcript_45818/g.127536 Transcript_45818/m.127536 type:complete len:241 (-) Transcript_45818:42-764(-)
MSASTLSSRATCWLRGATASACCACTCLSSASCPDQVLRCAISRSVALKASSCFCKHVSVSWSLASKSAVRSPSLHRLSRSSCKRCPLELSSSFTAALALSPRALACWQVLCISDCRSFSSLQTRPCLSSLASKFVLIRFSTSGRPCSRAPIRLLLSSIDFWSASIDDASCVSISLVFPTEAFVISWLPSSLDFSFFNDTSSACTFSARSPACSPAPCRADSRSSAWSSRLPCPDVTSRA